MIDNHIFVIWDAVAGRGAANIILSPDSERGYISFVV